MANMKLKLLTMFPQMDAMVHFMAVLFGAEVVARFIGDSAQSANPVAAVLHEPAIGLSEVIKSRKTPSCRRQVLGCTSRARQSSSTP